MFIWYRWGSGASAKNGFSTPTIIGDGRGTEPLGGAFGYAIGWGDALDQKVYFSPRTVTDWLKFSMIWKRSSL